MSNKVARLMPQLPPSSSSPARAAALLAACAALAVVALCAGPARADRVILKDGTVLEGTVIKRPNGYWVKTPSGTREVPESDVKSVQRGSTGSAGSTSAKPPAASGGTAKPPAPRPAGTITYASADRRAKAVSAPLAAVTIWQEFIDTKPNNKEELAKAKAEMAKWQKLADDGAEKINGKWVGGDERKAILEKANTLGNEAWEAMRNNQTLQAVAKFKESAAVYPNSFRTNFLLGYLMMLQKNSKEATKYLEAARKLRPDSPETMANLALLEIDKKQYGKAIEMLHKAVQTSDTAPIAGNLVAAINIAGPKIQRNQKFKPAIEAARLLASKYGIPPTHNGLMLVGLSPEEAQKPDRPDAMAGAMSSGTGFFIAADGLVLTNRHVVDGGKTFLVMMNDGTQASAEVVTVDDEQDLALLRIKLDAGKKVPFVQLSKADNPGDGAECVVMGYPLLDRLGANIKVTRGIVSSGNDRRQIGYDVTIDATVNPGNSGGPILDQHGNVMAIVSMKTIASALEDTYGLGISAGRIRKFLGKNSVANTPAEPGAAPLSAQDIAAKVKPAAVCILATR